MQAILSVIVAFFTFFKWSNFSNWVLKGVTFGSMLAINVILIAFMLVYFAAIFKILEFIYSKANYLIDYINSFGNASGEAAEFAITIFKSLGAWNAFVDVFNIFSVAFASVIAIYAAKLGVVVFKGVRDNLIALCISKI